MTLAQLIAQFRVDANDEVTPFLFSDAAVTGWLNEAQDEACERALLIPDWSTAAVCEIEVTQLVSTYSTHPSIINITRATFTPTGGSEALDLHQADTPDLDRACPHWRTEVDEPSHFIHTDTQIRLGCLPETAGTLELEVNRLPLAPMVLTTDTPEIAARHHRRLIPWALYRAFSVPDSETLDPNRAALAERDFTKTFGLRPDATIQRASESSLPHRSNSHWLG